ncbi:MAG: DUF2399 domain-containing protein [Firmicutes bacterium]|nr:DUF2399 domain-containing protein [Bacillota bacterium]
MHEKIIKYLKKRKKKTIPLLEIEGLMEGDVDYNEFSNVIKDIEKKRILIPVKSHGKKNNLYNTYRINKTIFKDELIDEIQTLKLKIHPAIKLDNYLKLTKKDLSKDLKFIKILDKYLKDKGLPKREASSEERSYEILEDEKWIDYKGGKKFLQRVEIFNKLKISLYKDPLMLAINKENINGEINKHMVIENKATFHLFLNCLNETDFTSLVYGSGWKIVGNIDMLTKQLDLDKDSNIIYYFGDLDYEGISIWNSLNKSSLVKLAYPFYKKLLKKPYSYGKENHYKNKLALENFLKNFKNCERKKIKKLLDDGGYYPQESLNSKEILDIWRNNKWK